MEELQWLVGDQDRNEDGSAGSVRWRIVDSSPVRVHRHDSGASRDGETPPIRLSRGGRTTKVHLGINGKMKVKTVFLTPGQVHDCTQAKTLLADHGQTVI